jgi:CheY-like chemotaxis protein
MQSMPIGGTIILSAKNTVIPADYHQSLSSGEYIRISVKDCGVGIPKEHLNLIFDPFFTTKSKGHGLGLSTCYSIIKKHNGCIEVESIPGSGSTFHVLLPVCTQPVIPVIIEQTMKHSGKGLFIIMDDEEVIRDTLEIALVSFGYTVVCKENGRDVLDYFKSIITSDIKIAGMFFDLTIPGNMGGKEAIVEIRKLDTSVPVFVASGYADDPVMSNPETYGFTGSISKPFRIADITKLLNKYMKE